MRDKSTIICSLLCLFLSLGACKNDTIEKVKETRDKVGKAKDLVSNAKKLEKKTEDIEERVAELKQLTPFDNEKFKSWMPESLDGMPRTSFNFQTLQASTGKLEFKNESGDRDLRISITDGAGEQGSALYTFQGYYTGLAENYESESDAKVEKVRVRNGQNSMETYLKKDNASQIKTNIDDRFIIDAEGNNMTPDELWALIDKLNISKLQ